MTRRPAAQPDHAPPLSAWAIAGVVSLLVGGGAYLDMRGNPPPTHLVGVDHDAVRATIDRLASDRASDASAAVPLVVALGTSLFDAAFPDERTIERFLRSSARFKVDFVRFVAYRVSSSHELIPYFDDLMATRPDVVIIEDQLLTWHRMREPTGPIVQHRRHLARAIRRLLGTRDLSFANPVHANEQKWDDAKALGQESSAEAIAAVRARLKSRRVLFNTRLRMRGWPGCPSSLPGPLARFLTAAREQGTTVIVSHLTSAREHRDIEHPRLAACRNRLARRLRRDYGVDSWRSPELPSDHYEDYTHFDERGRAAHAGWFIPKLGELLRKRQAGRQ